MEKKVIRIGSVGVGAIWTGVHEPGIRRSPDLELVAICDIDAESCAPWAKSTASTRRTGLRTTAT